MLYMAKLAGSLSQTHFKKVTDIILLHSVVSDLNSSYPPDLYIFLNKFYMITLSLFYSEKIHH